MWGSTSFSQITVAPDLLGSLKSLFLVYRQLVPLTGLSHYWVSI